MKKNTANLVLIIIVISGLHFSAFTQTRVYPDLTVTISTTIPGTTTTSDYAVYFDYASVGTVNCKYYTYYNVYIYRDGDADANIVYSEGAKGRKYPYKIGLPVGPSSNHRYGLRYREHSYSVYSCDEYSWSGFKLNDSGVWEPNPATSASDKDYWFNTLHRYSVIMRAITAPIKSPTNVTASDKVYFDKIVLNWKKGTDIPDRNHSYRIYKGTTTNPSEAEFVYETPKPLSLFLDTLTTSWTDTTAVPNDIYYYWVTTYTDVFPNQSNGTMINESPRTVQNAVLGQTKTITVIASDGAYDNSVKLEWENLSSFTSGIKIERSIPNSTRRETLAEKLSNSTDFYSDNSQVINGYKYTYYLTPISSGTRSFPSYTDTGFSKPNGIISGTIKSASNAGVDNVRVCARPVTAIPPGGLSVPAEGYCTYTGSNGSYEIRNVYYYQQADFMIIPYKAGKIVVHDFYPDSLKITLSTSASTKTGIDFTDNSVFTISGEVRYPVSSTGTDCGVQGVEIKINDLTKNIFTGADGKWTTTLQDEGTYKFTPVYKNHQFANSQGHPESNVEIADNVTNIDFTDIKVDSIKVRVQSGCGTPVANNYATVRITSPNVCYNKQFNTDAHGLLTVRDLPARKYDVQVVGLNPANSNAMNQIGNKPITIDLTMRDSTDVITTRDSLSITPADTLLLPDGNTHITPADTVVTTITDTTRVEVIPKAEFIYHSPLVITPGWEASGAEVVCQNTILMEQNNDYRLSFKVFEQLGNCPVTDGFLRIYDQVSDRENTPVDVPITNGLAVYTIHAGIPQLSDVHNHEKYLMAMPKVGFVDATSLTYWITVTGAKSQASSFVAKSPEIPWFVLHDPPGDSSYVYLNEGTVISNFYTHEVLTSGEGGIYADVTVGYGGAAGFRAGGVGKLQFTAGRDTIEKGGWRNTITFEEGYSTSPSRGWIGHNGDVFVGASLNMEYALADELYYDRQNCTPKMRVIPSFNFTGFKTTFAYTEEHVKNTTIPNLWDLYYATLGGREFSQLDSANQWQALEFVAAIKSWNEILAQNDSNRGVRAKFDRNVSFSGGASYTNEMTTDSTISGGGTYNIVINSNYAAGAKIENDKGVWVKSDFGVVAKFRYSNSTTTGTDTQSKRKVGYMLRDNDMGDFFSVDIKRDEANGVPAFDLKLGTTSCPYEPGSQPRDEAYLTILPNELRNVPIDGIAAFEAQLTNNSESRERRDYAVKVITNTNPMGASIKLGGVLINNEPVIYSVGYHETVKVLLTVEKGPLFSSYNPIGIVMYPPCEKNFARSDTAWIKVSFQSGCSPVSLYLPQDGWMVNQNNNNILNVAFTGYDLNDAKLENITLQCEKGIEGWIDVVTIEKDSLKDLFYDYAFNVSGLTDGSYKLRAKSYCGVEGGFYYSPEKTGIIDRTTPAPFGYPSPSDGFLHSGDEISVSFDKNIDCDLSAATIKLLDDDNMEIPLTKQCFGNKIILMPQNDLFAGLPREGMMMNATVTGVKDLSGNIQKYPVNWSFLAVPAAQANPPICPVPGIQCPANITVASQSGFCGAQVFYPDIIPSSDCGGPGITIQQTGGLPSGYFFPVGVTTNTYVLTNEEGKTATCHFDVTVYDSEPPVISDLSAELYRIWPPSPKMIPVALNYTATDNCGMTNCEIFAMGSDPGNTTSTRKTPVPIVLMDQHHILLVAKRSGPGEGREYSIFIRCRDEGGYLTQQKTTIFVPNDKMILKSTGTADQTELSSGISSVKPVQFTSGTGNEPFMAMVWPNPSKNNFNIEVISSFNEKVEVSVTDILGRMISNMDVKGTQPVSFGESLVPGVYFITVRQGVYLKNFKVVKQ